MSYGHERRGGSPSNDLGGARKAGSPGTPGKTTLTDALPVPGPAAALSTAVQRKANPGDGVRPDAEEALAKAGSSSGAPLPSAVRGKFEGGLGVDLGDVRVQTGGESAPAAQHKLEVSAPGDAAEVEADALADSLVAGTAAPPAQMSRPVAQTQRSVIYRKPPTGPSGTGTQGGSHTVAAGESLSKIARTWYGDTSQWRHIYETNKAVIGPDPNFIGVGMVLFIPPSDVAGKLGTEGGKGMDTAT